jgi:hypothetical protein
MAGKEATHVADLDAMLDGAALPEPERTDEADIINLAQWVEYGNRVLTRE